jgi:DNA-binding transcriptional regulator LsrR (DeoR family)
MYFLDNRSQDDIARVLETSRSNVSRMITSARTSGIVEIRIRDDGDRDPDLERALAERFGLAHVRVAAFRPRQDALAAVGLVAAEWLDGTLRNGQILAVSWGTTLQAVVAAVAVEEPRRLEIVPLVGGMSTGTSLAAAHELVHELAVRLGATYRYLHGPALLHSEAARDALLAEPSVGDVLGRARSADIALVGIGSFTSSSTAEVIDGVGLTPAQYAELVAKNPAGDTCCRFFDAEGRPVRSAVDGRVLAVELDDLRRIPTVVGVACGTEKTPGVLAALRGGILRGLLTDARLARAVLLADGAR